MVAMVTVYGNHGNPRYAVEKLGAKPGFFASLVLVVNEILKDEFPELLKDPQYVSTVLMITSFIICPHDHLIYNLFS